MIHNHIPQTDTPGGNLLWIRIQANSILSLSFGHKFRTTTRSFSFCWYVWFAMCSTENSIQMVLLTPLSKEHYVTKSSETEQYAKHHTFSLPHGLIHVFIPCARLRTYIHLKPITQSSRLKMLQIQFEINFLQHFMLQILCLPTSM
jgi:hypothetical protein